MTKEEQKKMVDRFEGGKRPMNHLPTVRVIKITVLAIVSAVLLIYILQFKIGRDWSWSGQTDTRLFIKVGKEYHIKRSDPYKKFRIDVEHINGIAPPYDVKINSKDSRAQTVTEKSPLKIDKETVVTDLYISLIENQGYPNAEIIFSEWWE